MYSKLHKNGYEEVCIDLRISTLKVKELGEKVAEYVIRECYVIV